MMKNKIWKQLIAGFMACMVFLTICIPVYAANTERTLQIGTLEELKEFARQCASDQYSKGLNVILTDDIDLEKQNISIPIFLGTFDGRGHHIVGLCLQESASNYGLFNRLESGAVVKHLYVSGEVTPAGKQSNVGGIVGENYGSVIDCTFLGAVVGTDHVGGMVGYNGNSGIIENCTMAGAVRGTTYVGGIAGQNVGTIRGCVNSSAVNTIVEEADINASEMENLEDTVYSILKREKVTENAVTSDTGGIAGLSSGTISDCINTGNIGYPHIGYNVGGVAGRQNGYVENCINRGMIQGRKDVGGIVGQMTPDVTLQTSPGSLDELQDELNVLQNIIGDSMDDAKEVSDTIYVRMEQISDYANTAKDSAHSMREEIQDFMDDLQSSADSLADVMNSLQEVLDQMDDSLSYSDQELLKLKKVCTEISQACDSFNQAMDAMEDLLSLLEDGAAVPELEQLRTDVKALKESNTALESAVGRALEEIGIQGTVKPETKKQIRTELSRVLDSYVSVKRDLADMLFHTDYDALWNQNKETTLKAIEELKHVMEACSDAVSHLGNAMNLIKGTFDGLRDLNGDLDVLFDPMEEMLDAGLRADESFSDAVFQMRQWINGWNDSSALNHSLNGIGNELSALNSELNRTNTAFLSDLRAVDDQFGTVMNLFLNLLNNTQNVDYTDVIEDVSEESLQSATLGKVYECTNYGKISADRNAGGIAGAMAIEYDLDPEDDLLSEGRLTRFTYQTKAILLACDNYGVVQAKKSCAGGVTGRMDIGTISKCGGWGNVSSESGDYVGGVAGLSLSSVRDCYAKCGLSGNKYVGGIVGSGSRVYECISMVELDEYTQLAGAIASEIGDEYSKNLFVSDDLAGVDRVSLSGKAEKITYEELCEREEIPAPFKQLMLQFVADDEVLKAVPFTYGDSFSAEIYPEAPAKEDSHAHWDKTELTNLHFDTVVTAVYEPYLTSLASEEMRDGRPLLFVEGQFCIEDELLASIQPISSLTSTGLPASSNLSGTVLEAWNLQIPDDGGESHIVRWLLPEEKSKNYTVYVYNGIGWEKTESEIVGSYLCFSMKNGTQFAVTNGQQKSWVLFAGIGSAVLVSLAVILVVMRSKKHAKKQISQNEKKELN